MSPEKKKIHNDFNETTTNAKTHERKYAGTLSNINKGGRQKPQQPSPQGRAWKSVRQVTLSNIHLVCIKVARDCVLPTFAGDREGLRPADSGTFLRQTWRFLPALLRFSATGCI